jgi:hypothetical protein
MLATANLGEQVAIIVLSAFIITMTLKGKDRICYICYGAWLGCFVFDQLFGLPGMIVNLTVYIGNPGTLPILIRIIGMICIIAIGALLVEYMNDGTIYNKAFNVLCILTSLLILLNMGLTVYDVITSGTTEFLLATFHDLYRLTMIFMFTFFAYDSAKKQLNKVDFSK